MNNRFIHYSDDSKTSSKSLNITTNQYVKTSYGSIYATGYTMVASVTVNYTANTPQYTTFYFPYNKMTNLNFFVSFGINSLNDNHIIQASHDNSAFALSMRSIITVGLGDWGTAVFIGSLRSKGL